MTELINHYVDQHSAVLGQLPGSQIDWLVKQRQQGIDSFRKSGFPGAREEDWRYTSLKSVTNKRFQVGLDVGLDAKDSSIALENIILEGLDSYRLVFIDGVFSKQLSQVLSAELTASAAPSIVDGLQNAIEKYPGIVEQSMSGNMEFEHGFAALNVAFSSDGYVVRISDGVKLDKPIEIILVSASENLAAQPRNSIKIGCNSEAVVIERHISAVEGATLCNSTSKIFLEQGARLEYYLLQSQDNRANHVSTILVDQNADSWFGSRTITLGGGLVRNNLTVKLNQPGAHCDMLGLYNISGRQHVDNHTNVIHAAPHCTSKELYKGVLDKRSRAVFHGRIKVAKDAQKTNATQANNNLLLSDNAEIDTKPQLEIYADDVKCAHGATVGQIDETALFYLRSRGIDESDARALLTFAFVNDVLAEIHIDPIRDSLEKFLADRLIEND